MMNKPLAYRIALCSVLIALSLALSFFESLILPALPIPGIKLGLANIITLFALYSLNPAYAFAILISRCFLASLFGGGVTAFVFSISGGLLSLFLMLLAMRCKKLSIFGVSILGASAHSIGQIFASALVFTSFSVFLYLPIMLVISPLTGTLIAFVSQIILTRTKMYKK